MNLPAVRRPVEGPFTGKVQEPVKVHYVRGRTFEEIILDDEVTVEDGDRILWTLGFDLSGRLTATEVWVERKVGE
jgi:hypothetical protein